jgi:hypothetical protein
MSYLTWGYNKGSFCTWSYYLRELELEDRRREREWEEVEEDIEEE